MEDSSNKTREEEQAIQLGDIVTISGGIQDKTQGKVYFVNDEMIHIMPNGVSNRIIQISIIDGDLDESLGIEDVHIEKGSSDSFIALQNFRVGQMVEAFKDGMLVKKYALQQVNEENDSIILTDENNEQLLVNFNFTGISLDLPFDVLRGREPPARVDQNAVVEQVENLEEEEGPDELLFEDEEIELEEYKGIEEIPSVERYYPDIIQRNDMLRDFFYALDIKSRKNENKLRDIRRIVELCLLMRNEIVDYNNVGIPSSVAKTTTFENIIDMVKSNNVSLSIPVADVKRVMYFDNTYDRKVYFTNTYDKSENIDNPPNTSENIDDRYLRNELFEENKLLASIAGNKNTELMNQLPNLYLNRDKYNKNNFISWSEKDKGNKTPFTQDKEFFRNDVGDTVEGLPVLPKDEKGIFHISKAVTIDNLDNIQYSMLRGLKKRIGRLKASELNKVLETAEEVTILNYLLFPKTAERELGTTRCGKLSYDIGRSILENMLIKDILAKEMSEVVPTTGSILSIGASGNTLGNISISDWLRNTPLVIYGLGDALIELASYGLSQKEFSPEQYQELLKKIEENIAHVKSHIKYIREKEVKEATEMQTIIKNNFISDERFTALLTNINSEGILFKLINIVQRRIPNYKENDIAIFSYLYNNARDILLSKLANNNNIAFYRIQYKNREYIENTLNGFKELLKNNDKVYQPFINTCPHVNDYNLITKVKDDLSHMKLLSRFLTKYQSSKTNNWIICAVCDKKCLCNHEFLLLQEFIHPREKDIIHKDLLLTFSGGVFQGKYICKNCGQPISSLDFDNSLEYDDDGRPLMGRSVLVNREEIENKEINKALGGKEDDEEGIEEISFDTNEKTLYYQTAKDIFDSVGVYPKKNAYIQIVENIDNEMKTIVNQKDYEKQIKGKKGYKPYNIYINFLMICIITTYCIIEIQTHIPDYTPIYNDRVCIPNFHGYPLGKETDKGIIHFMGCLLLNILKTDSPWKEFKEFLGEKDDKKRKEDIENYIGQRIAKSIILPHVSSLIIKKKIYITEIYGKKNVESRIQEEIIYGFKPIQDRGEEVIVTKAANTIEKIRGAIFEANRSAKDTIKKELIPYSERTCCLNHIQEPLGFWKNKEIQKLGIKSTPRGSVNSHSSFNFILRKEARLRMNITNKEYNALFLQVCNKGDRIGRTHEFGYNNICANCDLNISQLKLFDFKEKFSDKLSEKLEQDRINEYNGMLESLLKEQGIDVTRESFGKLLNTVHYVNSVMPKPEERIQLNKANNKEVYDILFGLNPEPFNEWKIEINKLFTDLRTLKEDASITDIAQAYGELARKYTNYIDIIEKYIGENMSDLLKNLLDQPTRQIIESMRSCILIPLQRASKGFNREAFLVNYKKNKEETLEVSKTYDLEGSVIDDIKKFLTNHTNYIDSMNEKITNSTSNKISYAIVRLSSLLNAFQDSIRGPMLPGGSVNVNYILKAGIAGILYELMNPNISVPDTYIKSDGYDITDNGNKIKDIIKELIVRYDKESFKLTEEEIRYAIAKRNESEKRLFIAKLDVMTADEKKGELMKKTLGLGDWARGGSKGIYAFDAEQYEFEKQQRDAMGMSNIEEGNYQREKESGYDQQQQNEDDY